MGNKIKLRSMFVCGLMLISMFIMAIPANIGAVVTGEEPAEPLEVAENEWDATNSGTYFENTGSAYLDIGLTSSEEVYVNLEVMPEIVSFTIIGVGPAISTFITMSGFERGTTYYRYQDGMCLTDLTIGSDGLYSFTQDLTEGHHVFFLKERSTVYIYSDGSVSDPTVLYRDGDTYTLMKDISDSIYIQKSGITLDGAGHKITGPGYYGIYVISYSSYTTIKNFEISGFTYGIYGGMGCTYNTLIKNSISYNTYAISFTYGGGVWTNYNTFSDNSLTDNQYGYYFYYCSGNHFYDNTISGSSYGMYFGGCTDYIYKNIIMNNVYGVYTWNYYGRYSAHRFTYNAIHDNTYGIYTSFNYDDYCYTTVHHNNIYGNSALNFFVTRGSVALYDTTTDEGNYWGHSCSDPALFNVFGGSNIPYDTNTYGAIDLYPYGGDIADTDGDGRYVIAPGCPVVWSDGPATIENLRVLVGSFDLAHGFENSLLSKLDAAQAALDRGNENAAINILRAFINAVEAQSGKELSEGQANVLIEYIEDILEAL